MKDCRIKAIIEGICGYYITCGHKYPWRINRTPFRVYVSEVLLQRTRAKQVEPVFSKIIEKYPDPETLLENFEDAAKEMYTLGRNIRLHYFKQGLEYIVTNYGGEIPGEKSRLMLIPGVGDYIAAAVRIFGYSFQDTIIDANVVRVLSRIYGKKYDGETRRKKEFIILAEKHSLHSRCVDYSYGILDFAADVCRPWKPLCDRCFLREYCEYTVFYD